MKYGRNIQNHEKKLLKATWEDWLEVCERRGYDCVPIAIEVYDPVEDQWNLMSVGICVNEVDYIGTKNRRPLWLKLVAEA